MTKRPIGTESLPIFEVVEGLGFLIPLSRITDPQTSHDAGASMREEAANQRAQILAFLLEHPQGATADALDEKLGWRSSTAGRRLSELLETHDVIRCDGIPVSVIRHKGGRDWQSESFVAPHLTQKTRQGRFAYLHIHQSHLDPSWLTTEEG